MQKFITSVIAIHNINVQLWEWSGAIIEENSMEEADERCKNNMRYLFMGQEVIDVQEKLIPSLIQTGFLNK